MRGRHTTSVARLLDIPGGGWVVDTPGVRAIGLVDIGKEDVAVHFPEFAEPSRDCAFGDCLHQDEDEDGCGVRNAASAGEIPDARYRSYLRLLESLEE